ncbi:MAG: thioredoxin family protein [Candidatus Bathyarchaeota archaeon]|nr:thioredoxin family protein [Candidatus Bathyarchaeota archaeon]
MLKIRQRTVDIHQYINNIPAPFRDKFLERKKAYKIKFDVVNKLKSFAKDYTVVAFSAEWCKDCVANIPVLALISELTGLEVRVFGSLKRDPLNTNRKWSIPPSPPEVETFHVNKIPYILVLNVKGEKLGEIIEGPRDGLTLEEELLKIIFDAHKV